MRTTDRHHGDGEGAKHNASARGSGVSVIRKQVFLNRLTGPECRNCRSLNCLPPPDLDRRAILLLRMKPPSPRSMPSESKTWTLACVAARARKFSGNAWALQQGLAQDQEMFFRFASRFPFIKGIHVCSVAFTDTHRRVRSVSKIFRCPDPRTEKQRP